MNLNINTLNGNWVRLEEFNETHIPGLEKIAQSPIIWKYMFHDASGEGFAEWIAYIINNQKQLTMIPFVVIRQSDNEIVGFSSYLNISIPDDRIEIGYTWFTPSIWGYTKYPMNAECMYLQIKHAFLEMGVNRIEFRVDSRNTRSLRATEAIGVTREGVLRQHMRVQRGYIRDTVVHSLLKVEWPMVFEKFSQYFTQF